MYTSSVKAINNGTSYAQLIRNIRKLFRDIQTIC